MLRFLCIKNHLLLQSTRAAAALNKKKLPSFCGIVNYCSVLKIQFYFFVLTLWSALHRLSDSAARSGCLKSTYMIYSYDTSVCCILCLQVAFFINCHTYKTCSKNIQFLVSANSFVDSPHLSTPSVCKLLKDSCFTLSV